ncbi:hypothetical protein CCUS01_00965 [Colletotrichum cuscutae]|uniref:Zn(2)-C6 fungal-type domain-containing protein n=1 Tax=Colletotrichum cuscutae TaxID=1209917 RepID=A0AAI9V5I3_9PEZI|nr:hypothetical protein CCUS01_00965 [Colletotrichum cuscutae]
MFYYLAPRLADDCPIKVARHIQCFFDRAGYGCGEEWISSGRIVVDALRDRSSPLLGRMDPGLFDYTPPLTPDSLEFPRKLFLFCKRRTMAVTMADGPIRKACDRCHRQKLSCKRVGDEACERCIRLKEECTSSPSLRYRKQHSQQQQHHHHHNHNHHQYGSTGEVVRRTIPTPKRQRTESGAAQVTQSDQVIVKTQHGGPVCGNTAFGDNAVVSPEAMLDMVDFDFGFGNSAGLYQPSTNQQQLPQTFTGAMDDLMSGHGDSMTHPWSPVHSATSDSAFTSPMAPQADQVGRVYLGSPALQRQSSSRSSKPHDFTPPRRARKRVKQRTRQIMLRPYAAGQGPSTGEWMPRITEVNSRLFELSSNLPAHIDSSEEPGRSSIASTPDDGSSTSAPFPVDEMFKLSRHFADLLAEMSPPMEAASPASDGGNSVLAKGLNSLSDPATCLFVLSTYVRLLDMYQKVFSCIHSELNQLESGHLFQSWKLPGVTVGSFAVDSAPSLQMSLTIQLAEEFLLQMRRASASLDPTLRSDGSPAGKAPDAASMFSGVVDVSFQALKRQEESLGKELKDLRKAMETSLDG